LVDFSKNIKRCATHYSYDIHGNVKVLIQDYAAMERSLTATQGAAFAATQR
jgi:hypothetical protein